MRLCAIDIPVCLGHLKPDTAENGTVPPMTGTFTASFTARIAAAVNQEALANSSASKNMAHEFLSVFGELVRIRVRACACFRSLRALRMRSASTV